MSCSVHGGDDEDRLARNGKPHALQPDPQGDRQVTVGSNEMIQSLVGEGAHGSCCTFVFD